MARRRKGRAITGWLIVNKPAGLTSTAIVNKARWAFRAQKAGHAGTLDPLATGLLAIAFGEATKTIPFAQEGMKSYRFTVRFGERTTTDDAEGEVIARSEQRPSDEEICAALPAFEGDIEQIPPQFSAVRVDGERAYDLAREGVALDLAARPLWVERLALLSRPDPDTAELELICGKGGYVRSIARDLGEALGCHAHVTALNRTASGAFTLENAIAFEQLDAIREAGEEEDGDTHLLPLQAGLSELPEVPVGAPEAARLRSGNAIPVAVTELDYGDEAWVSNDGVAIALVRYAGGMLNPKRVFATGRPHASRKKDIA